MPVRMSSLSIEKFNSLPKNEQADIAHAFGVYLMDYKTEGFINALYSLSDFYIEMIYSKRKTVRLVTIKTYHYVEEINKYLKRVDIRDLNI
jgi:hypothetical protein